MKASGYHTDWVRLLEDYRHKHATWLEAGPPEDDEAEEYRLACFAEYDNALKALVTHRAPSLDDLGEKIEIIAADYQGSEIPHEYLGELLADVHHLAALDAQPCCASSPRR